MMSAGGSRNRIVTRMPASSYDGVTFDDIVRYVARRLRMTVGKAALCVRQVLGSGIAFSRIEKTAYGRYRLLHAKPPGLVCKVKETRTSSDDRSSSATSDSE